MAPRPHATPVRVIRHDRESGVYDGPLRAADLEPAPEPRRSLYPAYGPSALQTPVTNHSQPLRLHSEHEYEPPSAHAVPPSPARAPSPAHSLVSDVSDLASAAPSGTVTAAGAAGGGGGPDTGRKARAVRTVPSRFLQSAERVRAKPADTTSAAPMRAPISQVSARPAAAAAAAVGTPANAHRSGYDPASSAASLRARMAANPTPSDPRLAADASKKFASSAAIAPRSGGAAAENPHAASLRSEPSVRSLAASAASTVTAATTANGPSQHVQLELLEHRLIQWCYINAYADHAFAVQEQKASASINTVWTLVEQKRRVLDALQRRLATATHARQVDQYLKAMEPALRQIDPVIEQLGAALHTLAAAVAPSVHRMPSVGIAPNINTEALEAYLENSAGLLSVVLDTSSGDVGRAERLASALDTLEQTIKAEREEINRCATQLRHAAALETTERSLAIQHIQLQDH